MHRQTPTGQMKPTRSEQYHARKRWWAAHKAEYLALSPKLQKDAKRLAWDVKRIQARLKSA